MEDEDFDAFKEATQTIPLEDCSNIINENMLVNVEKEENQNVEEKLGIESVTQEKSNEMETKENHFSKESNEKENNDEHMFQEETDNRDLEAKEETLNVNIENNNYEANKEESKETFEGKNHEEFAEDANNLVVHEVLSTKEIKENLLVKNESIEFGDKLKTNFEMNNDNLSENNVFQQPINVINVEETFSEPTNIDNNLNYSEKKYVNANENISQEIKISDPLENTNTNLQEILKTEVFVKKEPVSQEEKTNIENEEENIICQTFSEANIDNNLNYSEKKDVDANENISLLEIKISDPLENTNNNIQEILKTEVFVKKEPVSQEEKTNIENEEENIICQPNQNTILLPEKEERKKLDELFNQQEKHNEEMSQKETIIETTEEQQRLVCLLHKIEKIDQQNFLLDQKEEKENLPILSNKEKDIDIKELNRSLNQNNNIEIISIDEKKIESPQEELGSLNEEKKLGAEYDEDPKNEDLAYEELEKKEEQCSTLVKDEKNIDLDQLKNEEKKESDESDLFGDFEENQAQNEKGKVESESDKEKNEAELKEINSYLKDPQSPQNLLMDDENKKEIAKTIENEDNDDNDEFGDFEENCPVTEQKIIESENLVQNDPNIPKESEPKIIEHNLTISQSDQNSNKNQISNNNEIKSEDDDLFRNFKEDNLCQAEHKTEILNLIESSVKEIEEVNFGSKDEEIKTIEPKLEKECKIQEIDFDEGFDDFQGEQKNFGDNDKEGEEKKSMENKENKEEESSIDFGDFEESNNNKQEIQNLTQNQNEVQNVEQKNLAESENKKETIQFVPQFSNMDFDFQPIQNNSSTFEFPIFTSNSANLNPNFNFEEIIQNVQAKPIEEFNFSEAKRTETTKNDLDFFEDLEEEKAREQIVEDSSKKEDYVIFHCVFLKFSFIIFSPFLEGESRIFIKISKSLQMFYFLPMS